MAASLGPQSLAPVRSLVVGAALLVCALVAPQWANAQESIVVEGRVVDADTGKPLRGARITFPQGEWAHTGASGQFEILVPMGQPLLVSKPGYVRTPAHVTRGERNVVVRLPRAGALTVHLYDPAGEPVHAIVKVTGVQGGEYDAGTDERGERRFGNMRPGRYRVGIAGTSAVLVKLPPRELTDAEVIQLRADIARRSTTGKPEALATVDVRAGQEAEIHLVSVPPPAALTSIDLAGAPVKARTASVQGRVVDAEGVPIAGARVSILGSGAATSDASGTFRIGSLPAAILEVRATKPGFTMAAFEGAVVIALKEDEQRHDVVLTMAPASEITGRVLDEYEEPVERATVRLFRLGVSTEGTIRLFASGSGGESDDRGRYRITRVAPGAYVLLVTSPLGEQGETYQFYPGVLSPRTAHELEVPAGRDIPGIDFRLKPELGQQLSGTVVQSTANAFMSMTVDLTGTDVDGIPVQPRSLNLPRSGKFEFNNVAPGRYTVTVRGAPATIPQVVNGKVVRRPTLPQSGLVQIQVGDRQPDHLVIHTAAATDMSSRQP